MNPFEMTMDQDSELPTVQVKMGYVVLTEEEDERMAERIGEILTENERLREMLAHVFRMECDGRPTDCEFCEEFGCGFQMVGSLMARMGIEVDG